MNKYIKRYINNRTGMADHIQVSSEPTHDHIEPLVSGEIPVVIPGQPPVPALKYQVEEIEIEEAEPMRARQYLEVFNESKPEQDADTRFTELTRKPLREIRKP